MPYDEFKLKNVFQTLWFAVCLIPFSMSMGDGVSVNYLYALTPVLMAIQGRKFCRPPTLLMGFVFLAFLIYFVALVYQTRFSAELLRRSISLVLVLLPFSMCCLDLSPREFRNILNAIVLVSVCLAVKSIFLRSQLGSLDLDAASLKGEVGSQRIGVLYIYSVWIIIKGRLITEDSQFRLVFYGCVLVTILFGIVLTFSRATYVGTLVSFAYFVSILLVSKTSWDKKVMSRILQLVGWVLGAFVIVGVLQPDLWGFVERGMIDPIVRDDVEIVKNDDSSEGERLFIWQNAFEFVLNNPLTGTGFLGIWVLDSMTFGSCHSEYIDKMLRLGIFGFFYYFFIQWRVFKVLHFSRSVLADGFIGVAAMGLFHETYTLSQGGAIYAVLISVSSTLYRRHMLDAKGGRL